MCPAKRDFSRGAGAITIAATYVGTVVGAGFASGQEVLQFFTAFGRAGLVGLLVSGALFAFFGVRVLSLGRSLRARSHRSLLQSVFGRLAGAMDLLWVLFLLMTTAVMAAGAGSTMLEQYGWPRWLGSGLMVGAAVLTVLAGVRGVVIAMNFTVPVLIALVFAISFANISSGETLAAAWSWQGDPRYAPIGSWLLAAVLYVAYNTVVAMPVMATLAANASSVQSLRWGGVLGGVALAAGAAAVHFAVAGNMPAAASVDIPMLQSARALPGWVPFVYAVLLLVEIYTTAVGTLYGFASRVGERGRQAFRAAAVAGALVAAAAGQFSFAAFIATLYPLMGIAGATLLIAVLFRR